MRIGGVFKGIAAFVVLAVVTPVAVAGIAFGTLVFLPLPATLPEANPTLEKRITHILDADGNEIAIRREFETSIPVDQSEIPQVLKDAVIASEDKDFYSHGGIDISAIMRALIRDVRSQRLAEGGSTITQQYVKQAFTTGERSISRKIREAILAAQLDRQEDKDTILHKYLSIAYMGGGAHGVGAAAETFFRKAVGELTLSEAATLASVLPAPSAYEPRTNRALAEQRRVRVLGQMLEQGRIDQAAHDEAVAQPLWLAADGEPPGPVTLVHPPLEQQSTEPWFRDYVVAWLRNNLPGCGPEVAECEALNKGGLTVVTTLDPRVQAAAVEAVDAMVGSADARLGMGLAAIEPATGFIKAMVGGRDYAANQVNLAVFAGENGRQSGSSFKPFVLAAALEAGIQPTKVYDGSSCTVGNYSPTNFGGSRYGPITLRQGTWVSSNTVYCHLINDVGVPKTMEMARRLGLARTPDYDPAVHGLSVALGVTGTSPLEMASAYGVFANHGRQAPPTPVLRVTDADGKVLIDNAEAASNSVPVIDPTVADNVTDILRGVIDEGTARGKGLDRPAAGKTGTAEKNVNAWFVGYTPTLSTAVWIGYTDCENPDDGACQLRNVGGFREVTGGTLPATTWQRFMRKALEGVPVTEFSEPAPIRSYAEEAARSARGGFDPGPARQPAGTPTGGPYVLDPPEPVVSAPTTTTTTTSMPSSTTTSSSSTTSTTRRGLFP